MSAGIEFKSWTKESTSNINLVLKKFEQLHLELPEVMSLREQVHHLQSYLQRQREYLVRLEELSQGRYIQCDRCQIFMHAEDQLTVDCCQKLKLCIECFYLGSSSYQKTSEGTHCCSNCSNC